MNRMVGLHGFLGLPSDWREFEFVDPVSIWDEPILPFDQWARCFNSKYRGKLVGYSMGGRLALHALLDNPKNWEAAIFISTHPGNGFDQERINNDERWAEKFETYPWNQIINEWELQGVFGQDPIIQRHEKSFSRYKLAQSLRIWTLGRQKRLTEQIAQLDVPILWITGERDEKFVEQASKLFFKNPQSEKITIPNCGHRIQWNAPLQLKQVINHWFKKF